MPAIRTNNHMRSPTTGQILSATTGQPLSHSRPVRLTRQSYRLGFRIEDFDDTYAQARAALATRTSSSTSVLRLPETPPATPPTTRPDTNDTPTDVTPTPMSISSIHTTQPPTPTTPTPAPRGAPANRRALQRTYSVIISPGDVSMHSSTPTPMGPTGPTGSTGSPGPSTEYKSDVERIPRTGTGLQYMFDEIMGYDSEGEEEDECPGYGKMCQLRRFRMSDITFDQFSPEELPESDENMLTTMDRMTDAGLSATDFQRAFIQCQKCKGMIARRNIYFHQCASVETSEEFAPLDRVSLLHCTGTEGLTERSFEALMSYCDDCEKYMTYRASLHHDCVLFDTYFGEEFGEEFAMEMDLV